MEQTSYVRTDEHGVMRVADTHVMLDSIVAAFDRGHSPETIRSQQRAPPARHRLRNQRAGAS